jgi:outer membrane protein OmpA-like peptidoglycan-associated protein
VVSRLPLVLLCLSSLGLAQPALSSARGQWLLNPGAERSHAVGTGQLLGAGQFRVALATHLLAEGTGALALRQHVAGAWAPLARLQVMAQLPVVLLQRPAPSPELGVGRPWAGARVALCSPEWDDVGWLAVEAQLGIPGLEQAEAASRSLLPSGLVRVSGGLPAGNHAGLGVELGARFGEGLFELEAGATLAAQAIHLGGEFTVRGSLSLLGAPRGFVEVLGGIRYRLRPVELSLLGGPGYGLGGDSLSGRVVFSLAFVNPAEEPPESVRVARADCTEGTPYRLAECPELDWDNDGVKNGVDACPKESGERENDGCPWPDRDGDGTFDPFDNCPDEPGPSRNAGCPAEQPQRVVLKKDRLEILEVIHFEFNKADIRSESFGLLEQVAKVLNAHPEIRHVRIEGHTDRVGSAEYNRELSAARARTVKSFLVELGHVDGTRLSTRGYGFDRPIATNDTEEGRARNRRVEFLILREAEAEDADATP